MGSTSDHIEIWYAQKCVDRLPRLRGIDKHAINYRHVIDWLVRKPGAFSNYQYQDSLYPTIQFRMAYDVLHSRHTSLVATKEYLAILELAARDGQDRICEVLRVFLNREEDWSAKDVVALVRSDATDLGALTEVEIEPTTLSDFDALLESAASLAQEFETRSDTGCELDAAQLGGCVAVYDEVLAQR